LLVNPVTQYKARSRAVYLPAGRPWYDFWTGRQIAGGQTITADAPYGQIPLYVRAGSIVPFGPDQQYIGEKDARTLTLYVYAGAAGQFSLYEDDGSTYDYERRQFSRIPVSWNDATRTFSVGRREGSFAGMVRDRTINVVLVSPDKATGYTAAPAISGALAYRGDRVQAKF
jgi:alpha-D-xyloside xylohydrolase